MAKDEMEDITEDRWDEDIWGAAVDAGSALGTRRPQLVFYFGKEVYLRACLSGASG